MDRRTVKKRLEQAEPCDFEGDAPLYHLRTFLDALLEKDDDGASALEKERTRLTSADADIREIDRAERRNQVLPVDVSFQACSNVLFAVRRVIETSNLTNEEKDDIYREIMAFKPEKLVEEKNFEEGVQ